MICAMDVHYGQERAMAAAILFERWESRDAAARHQIEVPIRATYEPGRFYLRELPCLQALIANLTTEVRIFVVDGYVWLGPEEAGLGAHLYDALDGRAAVVGVAKRAYRGSAYAVAVQRGGSRRPLYVTAVGIEIEAAADGVRRMAGAHRIPTLLAQADRLARGRP